MAYFNDILVKCVPLTGFRNTDKHKVWCHFFYNMPVAFDSYCMIAMVRALNEYNTSSKYTVRSLFLSR
jgi:hypothetical protein